MLCFQEVARIVLAVPFLFFPFNVFAQDFEFFQVQAAYYTKQPINDAAIDGEIGFFEWSAQLKVPQLLKKHPKTIVIHKLGYANLMATTTLDLPPGKMNSTQYYHSIVYSLGCVQTLNVKWKLVANLIPTLASDFNESLSSNDVLFQTNALLVHTGSDQWMYGFGVAYTTRLGRQLLVPMGLVKWNAKNFEFSLILPNELSAMITTKRNLYSFGIKAGLNGGVFNNSSTIQTVSSTIDEVGYSRLTLGPALSIRLKDMFNISLQAGLTLNRRLEFVDSNEQIIDKSPQATPYISVGISIAPKMKHSQLKLNM